MRVKPGFKTNKGIWKVDEDGLHGQADLPGKKPDGSRVRTLVKIVIAPQFIYFMGKKTGVTWELLNLLLIKEIDASINAEEGDAAPVCMFD